MSSPPSSTPLDLHRCRSVVAEHYFRVFRSYNRRDAMRAFVDRWMDLLRAYSSRPGFLGFVPRLPLLTRLVPNAVGVLVVPFSNTRVRVPRRVSVFPLYMFRVVFPGYESCCREGLEMLRMYLDVCGVRTVGLYQIRDSRVVAELEGLDIRLYGPGSHVSFLRVCRRASS